MSDEQELSSSAVAEANEGAEGTPESNPEPVHRDPAPPVESRFMFVDIAAMRAKQLRRGALARVESRAESDGEEAPNSKLERIAMQEIEEGLIIYQLPDENADDAEEEASPQAS